MLVSTLIQSIRISCMLSLLIKLGHTDKVVSFELGNSKKISGPSSIMASKNNKLMLNYKRNRSYYHNELTKQIEANPLLKMVKD